ncbi:MAG: helix-turn-helix domain-containing protein [Clostridiales bacterium]|nr:helix-turn-helix domain-containing protein [Clostridiales bacterium]
MNSLEKSNKSTAVDIKDKKLLSVEEAAELFGIGRTKIRELSNGENCKFVLWVGGHRKIKREEFDQYLKSQYSV